MGQYKNGKWEPTWGDDQFGVVDTLPQMYNRNRDLQSEIHRMKHVVDTLRRADNWGRFAGITVYIDGKALTTIGNLIAESVGGLDTKPETDYTHYSLDDGL